MHWERSVGARSRSQKQEKRLAAELGAKLTPNSGATTLAKGDAVDTQFRYEAKITSKKRVPVDADVLRKIWDEASATGHLAAVLVTMEVIESPVPQDWVMIDKSTFDALRRGEV
jgi:hypothetical protein